MALSYALYSTKSPSNNQSITSGSFSVVTDDIICICTVGANPSGAPTYGTPTNSGTAFTWNSIKTQNASSHASVACFWAKATTNQSMTVTQAWTGNPAYASIEVIVLTGAHATDPLPSGKIYGADDSASVSQSITPTSTGSCLFMMVGDWAATTSWSAGTDCTINNFQNEGTDYSSALITPTTNPRTDTNAFTLAQAKTSSNLSYVAWEVQAAATGGGIAPGAATLTITGFAPTVTNSTPHHDYGTSARLPATATTTNANPATVNINCPAGTTVLWLGLVVGGTTARAGGDPTYNSVAMTAGSAKTNAGGTPETNAETWYMLNPPTGSSLTISVPNSGTLPLTMIAATGSAAVGYTTALEGSVQTPGNSTNPSTTGPTGEVGDITFAIHGNGATTWNPTARSGIQIYDWDAGSWGLGAQYFLETGTGGSTISYTFGTSEDWIFEADRFTLVVASSTVAPGAGSLTITGYAPTVTAVSGTTVAPGAGALSVTGYAPTANVKYSASPGAGALSIDGFAPIANLKQSAGPGAAALSVTGFPPTASLSQSSSPGASALTVTGFAPVANLKQSVSIGIAALTVTGFAPTVSVSISGTVTPGPATLSIDGFAPVANLKQSAAAGVAALTLAGYAPSVGISQSAAPGAGALTVTGYTPTVSVSLSANVTPGAGALSITGFAPVANLSQSAAPGPADLAIECYQPSVVLYIAGVVQPGPAALDITCYPPAANVSGALQPVGRSRKRRRTIRLLDELREELTEEATPTQAKRVERIGAAVESILEKQGQETALEQQAKQADTQEKARIDEKRRELRKEEIAEQESLVKALAAIEADNDVILLLLASL